MQPQLFGILNMTADSFSDGGQFLAPEAALAQADNLLQSGADVLDIGAASSHPDSAKVSSATEIERLEAVVPALQKKGATLSIDSYLPETQLWALQQGVAWLNDIQGFGAAEIYPELAKSRAKLCVMHSLQSLGPAIYEATPDGDVWDYMEAFFNARLSSLEAAGIDRDRLILDPGMGFFLGDTPAPSLRVLALISRLKEKYHLPVLVSVSRKSFLRQLSGRSIDESGPVTLAAELFAAQQGVDYIRTHDVAQLKDALALNNLLTHVTI